MPEPRSRRDRPAKPPLSRQWIIDTTIGIMRREGLGKATMRRVAKELDTGPASLYVYVRNTAELHAAVIDELLGAVTVQEQGDWQDRLLALVTDYRTILAAHPGLARSALVIRPSGPHLLALFDRAMGLFIEGGVDPAQAAWGVDLLLLTATASAAEHAEPEDGDVDADTDAPAKCDAMAEAVRAAEAPLLAEHVDAVLGGTPQGRWTWYFRAQIAGIAATPTSND
ncbi:TetR/AcrR family transcriptional regulator [Sciscionella sediminilitoris]|uniref:TetR/AcrR family transcriptional regulator n=1 Tax=Sciscionella sediminilitoris TaxID=1445613 RepID=UPI0004DEE4AF|nr:TetR/AcrR family transcriptional regulator [Sciscionella sp. SE31]